MKSELVAFLLLVLGATGCLKPPLAKQYDFIVVGAGTAGSVVANRLSEISDWKVLLLEAGGDEGRLLQIPMAVTQTIATGISWNYSSEPTPNACQNKRTKRCPWPKGKALGGNSVNNLMLYTRGNRLDYDSWEAAGNPGWSYKDVLPYFLKSEDQQNSDLANSSYHSVGGPLSVDISNYHTASSYAFLDAVKEMGYPVRDFNGAQQYGFDFAQAMIGKGRRCSANRAFLNQSVRKRPNLTISIRSRVHRILLEGHRAVGVEVLRDGTIYHIRAKNEVILSAGSLNDPQILMLSGIGPQDHLQELKIPVVKNLSVGLNLQDHAGTGFVFEVDKSLAGLTEDEIRDMHVVDQWLAGKGGPLSVPGGCEVLGFVSSKQNKYGQEWPDIELILVGTDTKQGGLTGLSMSLDDIPKDYEAVTTPLREQPVFSLLTYVMRPKNRGFIRLSSTDPKDPPKFYSNYFSDPDDRRLTVEGLQLCLKLAASPKLQKIIVGSIKPNAPGCENLQHESVEYLECLLRTVTYTFHHQAGTCKMGPSSDPDAVVDHRLRLHGIKGLRVADASIMPTLTSCHTASVAYMIGEKAADMVKQDWSVLQ